MRTRLNIAAQRSEMIAFSMAKQLTANADEIVDVGNTGLITAPFRIGGTTTSMWSGTARYFTPPGDQTGGKEASAAMREFLRLDTLGGGAILMCAEVSVASSPTEDRAIVDACSANTSAGGYHWRFQSSNIMTLRVTPAGGSDTLAASITGMSFPYSRHVAALLDVANLRASLYENAVLVDDRAIPSGSLPTCDTTRGLQMFARNTNGTTLDKRLSGVAIRNFRMFRFRFNVAEVITDLLVEIARNPGSLRLRALEGL